MNAPRLNRRGFTLIELLVVVGIIALLIAILTPSLISVREQAKIISCQSNLRSVTMAWHAFLRDNRERLPRGLLLGTTFGGKQGCAPYDGYTGPRLLNRYLQLPPVVGYRDTPSDPGNKDNLKPFAAQGAVEVFRCPGDRGSFISTNNLSETVYATHWDYYGTIYRSNRLVIGPTPPRPTDNDPCAEVLNEFIRRFDQVTISLNNLANESRLVLMGDYPFDDWQSPASDTPPLEFHARAYGKPGWSGFVSDPGSPPFDFQRPTKHNLAFMDGHAALAEIKKGIYVSAGYTVVPFPDLQSKFAVNQHPGYYP